MRQEMLQSIHEGHQGKEHSLLRAKDTVFWPRITLDVQQMIEKCVISQEYRKPQPLIGITQEIPPFLWCTIATDLFYWKLLNSRSIAICIELSMIVTDLGLPHITMSDNGPCYNSKEFQQFLQCCSIHHQTSIPNHQRSNGFVECMTGVAKKLMGKAGKERKPWISGLFEYRITPQAGNIASPLELMTQHRPREKNFHNFPVHWVHHKCIKHTRSSSGGKETSQKGSIRSCSQAHQFGYNTGKMPGGNLQQLFQRLMHQIPIGLCTQLVQNTQSLQANLHCFENKIYTH